MKQKAEYRIGVGASSILMILVTLALAALALLSLYAAKNNAALCRRNVEMTESYYIATSLSQSLIAAIDECTDPDWLEEYEWRHSNVTFRNDSIVYIDTKSGKPFSFAVDAGAGRSLDVEGAAAEDGTVTLTRHALVSAPSPTEPPLPVYQP
jgi:hypothetical protein